MRRLDGRAERVAVLVLVVGGEASAGLHRVPGHPVDADPVAHDVGRPGETRLGLRRVADLVGERLVARIVVPDRRRAGRERVVRRDQGGQGGVIDGDQLRRVPRLLDGLGDHESDRLADHPHAVSGQERLRRLETGRAVCAPGRHRRPHRAEPARREIVTRQDREHAGRRQRGFQVDRFYVGMRVGGAQDAGARLVRRVDVVEIAAPPPEQPVILVPPDGVADAYHGHSANPFPIPRNPDPPLTASPRCPARRSPGSTAIRHCRCRARSRRLRPAALRPVPATAPRLR